MKCFVYRNLRKGGVVYSIRALEGDYRGKVIAYASALHMENVYFQVHQSGQVRARREKQRNVHAGLVGDVTWIAEYEMRLPNDLVTEGYERMTGGDLVTYNPWRFDTFVHKHSSEPIVYAKEVNVWFGDVCAYDFTDEFPAATPPILDQRLLQYAESSH